MPAPVANPKTFHRNPQAAAVLQRALHAFNAGNLGQAEALTTQGLAFDKRDLDAAHLMANIYLRKGQYEKAEEMALGCVQGNKRNAPYYLTLSTALERQQKFDEALAVNHKALALNATGLEQHFCLNIGHCYYFTRQLPEAIDWYNKALALNADFATALFCRGLSYHDLEGIESKRSEEDFNRALALEPGNVHMLQHMASIIQKHDYPRAIELLQQALRLKPDLPDAWAMLANYYNEMGKSETALSICEDVAAKYPGSGAITMQLACMFPPIPKSVTDIDRWRERFFNCTGRLMKEGFIVSEPERKLLNPPFYQAYHGRDNRALMEHMARFFLQCCPDLAFTAPHCLRPGKEEKKARVGFVSHLFNTQVLSQFYGPLITALANDGRFEVVLIANTAQKNAHVENLAESVHRHVVLPEDLRLAQKIVAAEELDMLIYLDIGMQVINYLLAFARLAPIQMVMGGHPITTGIPNVDYFISSKIAEPQNGAEHYSEKLLLLEKNTVVFTRKEMPAAWKTRAELGLPAEARLYACPVMPFKLHPDMDKVFDALLERDPQALIILFDANFKTLWRTNLQERFAAVMPKERLARIHFLPFAHGEQFYHLMHAMDCVLDTFHFSFGTTAFVMISVDVPFVTLPGLFLRGQAGQLLYKQMGIDDLIARSPEHFVELALKLAQDKEFHERMVEKIRAASHVLFDDRSVIAPFAEALWNVYQEPPIG